MHSLQSRKVSMIFVVNDPDFHDRRKSEFSTRNFSKFTHRRGEIILRVDHEDPPKLYLYFLRDHGTSTQRPDSRIVLDFRRASFAYVSKNTSPWKVFSKLYRSFEACRHDFLGASCLAKTMKEKEKERWRKNSRGKGGVRNSSDARNRFDEKKHNISQAAELSTREYKLIIRSAVVYLSESRK